MRRQVQTGIAFVIAFAIFAALVSPLVPSPNTTVRGRHVLHPPNAAHLIAIVSTMAAYLPGQLREIALQRPAHPIAGGSDLVDVTSARLC